MNKHKAGIIYSGLSTGLLLQAAVGPVFFLILNISIRNSALHGLAATAGVAVVDYLYILLAAKGTGKLLQGKKTKEILGLAGPVVLIILGIIIAVSETGSGQVTGGTEKSGYILSFFTAFIITVSNPLTIVFWTGIFSARALEKNYNPGEVLLFGLSAGAATIIFLGSASVLASFLIKKIPRFPLEIINSGIGIILICYGLYRLYRAISRMITLKKDTV